MKCLLTICKTRSNENSSTKKNPSHLSLLFLNMCYRRNSIIPSILEEFKPVVCLENPE